MTPNFREIAEKVARHDSQCQCYFYRGYGQALPCTCGRDAEVVAIAKALEEAYQAGKAESDAAMNPCAVVEEIFQAYPKRVAKIAALKAIAKALKQISAPELLAAVKEFAASPKGQSGQFCPYPATWFNAGSWNDDRAEWNRERTDRRSNVPQDESAEFERLARVQEQFNDGVPI